MHNNMDRSMKALLALLTIGVWGVLLRPFFVQNTAQAQAQGPHPQVGRYAIVYGTTDGLFILDTTTGTFKHTDQKSTYTGTWDKNYLNGTITPTPPADKK